MLAEWIDKVNKFVIKSSKIFDRRWEDYPTGYENLFWATPFTPRADGLALFKVTPSSTSGTFEVAYNENNDDTTLYRIKEFTGTAVKDIQYVWIAVQGGRTYSVYGRSATVEVKYYYFRK